MAGVNKVILVGNLGKDPEVRSLEGGRKVANVTLATSEKFKDREGNPQERTEWHRLSIWGPQAEVAEKYLRKGSQIYCEGKLRTREYEQEGQKKYSTEIMVDNFTMLGGRPDGGGGSESQGSYGNSSGGGGNYNQSRSNSGGSTAGSGGSSFGEAEPDDLPF